MGFRSGGLAGPSSIVTPWSANQFCHSERAWHPPNWFNVTQYCMTSFLVVIGWLLTIFLSAAGDSFIPDCVMHFILTVVCTFALLTCNCFEMSPSDFPDVFKSITRFFRLMLNSFDFPTVVSVAESSVVYQTRSIKFGPRAIIHRQS